MPDVQEVFHMTTRKVRPEPGDLDGRRRRHRAIGAYAVTLVVALAAIAIVLANLSRGREVAPPRGSSSRGTATETARRFLDAFGSFDAERAQGFLAKDADVTELIGKINSSQLEGTPEDLPTVLSMLRAQRYEASVHAWDVATTPAGTKVRCWIRWNLLRSHDLGAGPYRGVYVFTVRDGSIVRAKSRYSTRKFATEVFQPFTRWVLDHHPAQAEVMFTDASHAEGSVTERSIALWGRYVDEYVRSVEGSSPW
jgi:hypothetical protein